jgi:exodeoxyribonuclease III
VNISTLPDTAIVKIVSWNVNSVNARLAHLERFIKEQQPHILLLQETRCKDEAFPGQCFEDMGYNIIIHGQKARNGVAILSKSRPENVFTNLMGSEDEEARYIECCMKIEGLYVRVASVYVPNGMEIPSKNFDYKLKFLQKLRQHLIELSKFEEILVVGGDFNVAPDIKDVTNHKRAAGNICFHIDERELFRHILHDTTLLDGWRLLHWNATDKFSWWDYRRKGFEVNRGMRLDTLLLSPQAADLMTKSEIFQDVRGWKRASDHAPIGVEIKTR